MLVWTHTRNKLSMLLPGGWWKRGKSFVESWSDRRDICWPGLAVRSCSTRSRPNRKTHRSYRSACRRSAQEAEGHRLATFRNSTSPGEKISIVQAIQRVPAIRFRSWRLWRWKPRRAWPSARCRSSPRWWPSRTPQRADTRSPSTSCSPWSAPAANQTVWPSCNSGSWKGENFTAESRLEETKHK